MIYLGISSNSLPHSQVVEVYHLNLRISLVIWVVVDPIEEEEEVVASTTRLKDLGVCMAQLSQWVDQVCPSRSPQVVQVVVEPLLELGMVVHLEGEGTLSTKNALI